MNAEPDFFSVNAYNAFKIIYYVGSKDGWDSDNIKKGLLGLKNYQSVGGSYSFDDNGEITGKPVAIKTVKDGQFIYLTEVAQ